MHKIVFFEADEKEEKNLRFLLSSFDLDFEPQPLSLKNFKVATDAQAIGIFVHSKIDKKILDKLSKLKLITTLSTGYDHIDLKECKKRGITITNVPTYGDDTVAEHTFALILAISRRLFESVERVKKQEFSPTGLTGFNLHGKTIGIIGTGKIGSYVAKIAHGFGMNIIAYSRHQNQEIVKKYGVKYLKNLNELLKKSNIVSLHTPLTKETHHMINKNNLKKAKIGCVLINTSRGALIETSSLIDALKTGEIAYAGLDVLEGEDYINEEKELLKEKTNVKIKTALANHILLTMPNVIITPHNAFNSYEALDKIIAVTSQNIRNYFAKKELIGKII